LKIKATSEEVEDAQPTRACAIEFRLFQVLVVLGALQNEPTVKRALQNAQRPTTFLSR
jgi:hypothetical protein